MQHETFGQYPGQKNQTIVNGPNNNYALVESEITDLVLAEGRLEALRSLVLMFLNEIENIKKMLGTKRPRSWGDGIDLEKELDAIEIGIIKHALLRCQGNQAAAARLLSINPSTLHAKLKKHGITSNTASTVD
jgi:DNA-binding NtrC family response regulator